MEVKLVKANEGDAEEIWNMQRTAFAELLEKYKDFDTSPANEPLKNVVRRLRQPFTFFYFITLNGEKIGAIRVVDKSSSGELKRISPIFILPKYRNKGYAQSAISYVEEIHGNSDWALDTILQEKGNCHLYEKMGYRKTDKKTIINAQMTLISYKK